MVFLLWAILLPPMNIAAVTGGEIVVREAGAEAAATLCDDRGKAMENKDTADFLDKAMHRGLEEPGVQGVGLLVMRQGEVLYRSACGTLTTETAFQAASSAKPITAALILKLADAGLLTLDDEVSKYLPEFADVVRDTGEKPREPIRLRHVLTNSSGLPGDFDGGLIVPLFSPSLDASARGMAKKPLRANPGAEFRYCTMGFNVAARIAEIVTKTPYPELMSREIFQPLGMSHTRYGGFHGVEIARPPDQGPFLVAGGGLYTTLDDLSKFYRMLDNDGKAGGVSILSPKAVRMMRSPQIPLAGALAAGAMGDSYGVGLFLDRKGKNNEYQTFSHAGMFGSLPWSDRDRGLIGVVFVQGRFPKIFQVAFQLQNDVRNRFNVPKNANANTPEPLPRP